MSKLLKSLVFIFTLTIFSFLSPQPVQANTLNDFVNALQTPDYNLESMIAGKSLVKNQAGQNQAGSGLLTSTADALTVFLIGYQDPNSQAYNSQGSLIGSLAGLTASFYHQPVSNTQYLAYLKNNLQDHSLIKPAYAETKGQQVLGGPILELWLIVRNFSYIFFVIIFVVFGFMIMFRAKLNPQTVINIQQALPKIIISLILVTFSYAILSFIVDLAFFSNNLLTQMFSSKLQAIANSPENLSTSTTVWKWHTFDQKEGYGFISQLFHGFGGANSTVGVVFNFLSNMAQELVSLTTTGNVNGLLTLVLAFTLVGSVLKIFFALLTKHVTIILTAIASPLIFLFGSLSKEGVSHSLKSFASACLTFPATLLILNLSLFFSTTTIQGLENSIPPFYVGITQSTDSAINTIGRLIGLGMLMIASKIPDVVDQALGVKGGAIAAAGQEISGGMRKIPLIGGLLS